MMRREAKFLDLLKQSPDGAVFNPWWQIDRANDIVAHRFPEIVSSTAYDVKLPSGTINWSKRPPRSQNSI